ncbi:ccch zinc finger DNA-binding protein [Sporothrix brasiliensis 5110]|uniref:Ccch zinc finger DNA-binding protein n=1 Tax=Sporothrix brasiliensis 5110 TaxID=1398154 RepID=A0A0C2J3U1_9PEZI|nr:ccch zinc finger DNA-binding protein [Sporothrix brasiliensis 5110]KIH91737.1 ccch zinc finger DNA-binding protein [Sporothrix brasiliensis 5110]
MVSDETYDICLPILQDASLEEEDKIDRLESLLKKATTLQGQSLENAVLDAVWRYREGGGTATSPPPIRQTILRRPSPASWRGSNTPLSGSPRLGVSPLVPPGFVPASIQGASFPPSFTRNNKSTAASPFGSPRPSPRLGFATPAIPHSPSLNAYEFASDHTPAAEIFGDAQQTDNVDWLVSDDAVSVTSSLGGGSGTGFGGGPGSYTGSGFASGTATPSSSSGLNAAAPEFSLSSLSSQQVDMTPYDMLRSILGPSRTDDEIDAALAMHGYDLGATITAIMEQQQQQQQQQQQKLQEPQEPQQPQDAASFSLSALGSSGAPFPPAPTSIASSMDDSSGGVLIGKSMTPDARPSTPADQKSGILCKFFLSTGQCLRADCRFSHDLSNHICKYWVAGNCLAGNTCVFSHDPAHLITRLNVDGTSTPPSQPSVHDYSAFPVLQPQPSTPEHLSLFAASGSYPAVGLTPPPGFKLPSFSGAGGLGDGISRPRSRPSSRHQMHRQHEGGHHGHNGNNSNNNSSSNQAAPSIDDTEAFPTLGSAVSSARAVSGKKHHGKRGGQGHKDGATIGSGASAPFTPSSLADIVKMSPSPTPEASLPRPATIRKLGRNGSMANMRNGETSAAAQAIPTPKHIPWLETGDRANKAYLKARQEAIKHGGLRNKFLQSAAQAWNRNDARAAKALSLRGQSENDLMRKAHREAARELYEERNRFNTPSSEIYVDLHGLHPEEAVEYLERVLLDNGSETKPVYAITGTGHHSKNGKDKVGKAVRNFLNEWRYAYREFSVPSDRNNMGGILGIDARSWDKSLGARPTAPPSKVSTSTAVVGNVDILSQGVEIGDGKVKLLVRDSSVATKEVPKGGKAVR